MNKSEWTIAVVYTLATAMEAMFILGVCTANTDVAVIWLLLAVIWGVVIIASLFKYNDDV